MERSVVTFGACSLTGSRALLQVLLHHALLDLPDATMTLVEPNLAGALFFVINPASLDHEVNLRFDDLVLHFCHELTSKVLVDLEGPLEVREAAQCLPGDEVVAKVSLNEVG